MTDPLAHPQAFVAKNSASVPLRPIQILGKRPRKDKLRTTPLPLDDFEHDIVGWESHTDPNMPFNFSTRQKWTWVWLLSATTFLGPFATSILSPATNIIVQEFHNDNATVGSMTVTVYLLGYVVGPIFIGPLSEVYGRRPVLNAANCFFCVWHVGCALAPNIETLIVSRLFAGVGGAACLVS